MTVPSSTTPLSSYVSKRSQDRKLFSFGGVPILAEVKKHSSPISLGGGRPHSEFFPINKITLEIASEPFHKSSDQLSEKVINKRDKTTLDITQGFQYGPTEGHPQLRSFTKELISTINKPGYDSWDLTLTNGTGDSLHKVFNLLINPGDVVLIENFTYVPVVSNISNYGGIAVPVELDFKKGGIDVVKFKDLLETWETGKYKHLSRPKALYTIPTGQNPLGISLPVEQRKEIYDLSSEYEFLIIEDDPYGYIQLGEYTDGVFNKFAQDDYSVEKYVKEDLPNSYIQYDTEGRVLRLESFSKVFAPGSRLGFITGHEDFIKRIITHAEVSTRAPSGLSQVIVQASLEQFGGVSGWLNWNIKISKEYTHRKNLLFKALSDSKSFKDGNFEIIEPTAGMFFALNINFPQQEAGKEDYRDELEKLRYKALEYGVVIVLGKNFTVDEEFSKKARFIRLTIATQDSDEEILEAGKRLTLAIESYFKDI